MSTIAPQDSQPQGSQPEAAAPAAAVPVTEHAFDSHSALLASLMAAAQAGDGAAYDHLLRECIPFIRMVVRRAGVPADFVDDAVQETLITIHRFRHTYDPKRPFGAWLRTLARHRAVDVMRSIGRTAFREVHEPLTLENHRDPADNPEEIIDLANRKTVAKNAIASLPAKQRQAVEQLVLKGTSLLDAAVATGLAPGALKVNLHRAMKTLRSRSGAGNFGAGAHANA